MLLRVSAEKLNEYITDEVWEANGFQSENTAKKIESLQPWVGMDTWISMVYDSGVMLMGEE